MLCIIPSTLIHIKSWQQEKETFRNSYRGTMQVEEGPINNEQIELELVTYEVNVMKP
jgi:hypothetical protein